MLNTEKHNYENLYELASKPIVGYAIFKTHVTIYTVDKRTGKHEVDFETLLQDIAKGFETNFVKPIWHNPPLDMWLVARHNWCMKIASKFARQYSIPTEEALSDLYYVIVTIYSKNKAYLGSLNYVITAVGNKMKMKYRYDKKRLYGLNVSSLNTPLDCDTDGAEVTLMDLIPSIEISPLDALTYSHLYDSAIKFMSKTFSEREIKQLLEHDASILPHNLYRRFLKWKQAYPPQVFITIITGGDL